jgi:hypothetical protein
MFSKFIILLKALEMHKITNGIGNNELIVVARDSQEGASPEIWECIRRMK